MITISNVTSNKIIIYYNDVKIAEFEVKDNSPSNIASTATLIDAEGFFYNFEI